MGINLAVLDWSLLQSFIAVAEEGSLTAAATRLGHSQPTLGRHIRQIETALGLTLFTRAARGLTLTEIGLALLPAAKEMQAAAAKVSLIAAGQSQSLSGVVRITASAVVSHHVLPPILALIRQAEPEIELELHASDSIENLLFHEADIAVRMFRPQQLDVVARKIGDFKIGLYAAQSYLDRVGQPETMAQLMALDWVGYDRSELILRGMRELGWSVDKSFFKTRCDDQTAYWELLRSGCGIGAAQEYVARKFPDIVRVLPEIEIPPIPVWLAAPQALKQTPRIRRVFDLLADALSQVTSA